MCIRDSAGAVHSDRLFAAAGDPADHRQRYDAAWHGRDPLLRPAAGAAGPGEPGHRPAADPVSYTHLDVYKRQLYGKSHFDCAHSINLLLEYSCLLYTSSCTVRMWNNGI